MVRYNLCIQTVMENITYNFFGEYGTINCKKYIEEYYQ